MALNPFAAEPLGNLGMAHLVLGRPDSALSSFREARSQLRGLHVAWAPSSAAAGRALIDVQTGDTATARSRLRRLERSAESPFYPGLVRAALGQREEALEAFERVEDWSTSPLLAWPTISLRYLYADVLDAVRTAPRYEELIRKINRQWGLRPDGSLIHGSHRTRRLRRAGPGAGRDGRIAASRPARADRPASAACIPNRRG